MVRGKNATQTDMSFKPTCPMRQHLADLSPLLSSIRRWPLPRDCHGALAKSSIEHKGRSVASVQPPYAADPQEEVVLKLSCRSLVVSDKHKKCPFGRSVSIRIRAWGLDETTGSAVRYMHQVFTKLECGKSIPSRPLRDSRSPIGRAERHLWYGTARDFQRMSPGCQFCREEEA